MSWKVLRDLIYPPQCALCRSPCESSDVLCAECAGEVEWTEAAAACRACGARIPVGAGPVPSSCGECLGKPIRFDGAVALGAYEGKLRELVIAFKQPAYRVLTGLFVPRLAARLGGRRFDAVVPVPMHRIDFILRGYNAAAELAAGLARQLEVPERPRALRKLRRTRPQKNLVLRERLVNLRGAFEPAARIAGRVLLVDDVLTSGATLTECADALRRAGAMSVEAAVVARGQAATVELASR